MLRKTVTLIVPDGYASGEEFAKDCGFEIVKPHKIPWDAYHNRSYGPVEDRAKEIYGVFSFNGPEIKPVWVPHGNSVMQDEARIYARRELHDAGHLPE